MSLLEYPSTVHSLRPDELEDAFRTWADDPAKPDVVDLGQHRKVSMAQLSRRLTQSQATLTPSACAKIGLPPGVTIATATAQLLQATTVTGPNGQHEQHHHRRETRKEEHDDDHGGFTAAAQHDNRRLCPVDPDSRSTTRPRDTRPETLLRR